MARAASGAAPFIVLSVLLGGAVATRAGHSMSMTESVALDIACSAEKARDQMPDSGVVGMVVALALPEPEYAKISKKWLALDGQEIQVKDYPDLAAIMLGKDSKHKNDKSIRLPDYSGLSLQIPTQAATEALTAQQLHVVQFSKARPTPATIGEDRVVRWFVRAKT